MREVPEVIRLLLNPGLDKIFLAKEAQSRTIAAGAVSSLCLTIAAKFATSAGRSSPNALIVVPIVIPRLGALFPDACAVPCAVRLNSRSCPKLRPVAKRFLRAERK